MTRSPAANMQPADVERFRLAITARVGLTFDEARCDTLAAVLAQRMDHLGLRDCGAYLQRLADVEEQGALATQLTTGETYFFRNRAHFRVLLEEVLPVHVRGRRPLRILSAGCSSGEEAYTIAILCREVLPAALRGLVSIHAIDLNPAAVARARAGRYSAWSLRDTEPTVRERWFRPSGREFVLDRAIQERVVFETRNLVDEDASFWRPGAFDVIFCRNVVMYFAPEALRAVVARLARSLAHGGHLFLGHAETLRGVSDAFHLRHTHDTFYYQRRGDADPIAFPGPTATSPSVDVPAGEPLPVGIDWLAAIEQATQRIVQLEGQVRRGRRSEAPRTGGRTSPGELPADLGAARELLRQDRFAEGIDALPASRSGTEPDLESLLLRAVLLMGTGAIADAERLAARILAQDELHAAAHYLMALCREHANDRSSAIDHDQAAIYLDPGFAMPHLHLGRLARRAGDAVTARRELAHALALLASEDAARLLLFGGGFTREALVRLCRSELLACGPT